MSCPRGPPASRTRRTPDAAAVWPGRVILFLPNGASCSPPHPVPAPVAGAPGGGEYGRGMTLADRAVLILAADYFEEMELLYPRYRLIEEEVAVTVAGLDDHPVRGKNGF